MNSYVTLLGVSVTISFSLFRL